ncbi:MAG: PQQ-like beta-propeller repeat protein [Calditrichaeota bacterium]|nr:PQQ-like beta-propeller repeat protein [Calditrichota bacterium]
MDAQRNLEWERILGFDEPTRLESVIDTDDGRLICAGVSESQFFGMALTQDGEIEWANFYGLGYAHAAIELKAGGLIFAGISLANGQNRAQLTSVRADGEVNWQRYYSPGGSARFYTLREVEDDIIAAGWGFIQGDGDHVYAVRASQDNGDVIWERFFRDLPPYQAYSMVSSVDGNYLLTGFALAGRVYPYLMNISSDGNFNWLRIYENLGGNARGYSVARLDDGYLIVGSVGIGAQQTRPIAIRTANTGLANWASQYAVEELENVDAGSNNLNSTIRTTNNLWLACGWVRKTNFELDYDGILASFVPDTLAPIIRNYSPRDTLVQILSESSIDFLVEADSPAGQETRYEWYANDTLLNEVDNGITLVFPRSGDVTIRCRASNEFGRVDLTWLVRVRDLFIITHSPDTLSLTIRRNSEIDFSLDSVAYIGDSENLRYEWLIYDSAAVRWEEVAGDDRIGIRSYAFDRTGGYALKAKVFDPNVDPVPADSVQWAIQVRGVLRAFEPNVPEISLEPRQEATFELIPFNANNDSIQFWWTLDEADDTLSILSTLSISFADTGRYVVSGYAREQVGEEEWEEDVQRWAVNVGMLSVDDFGLDSGFRRNDDPLMISIAPNPFNDRATVTIDLGGRAFLPALRADKNVRLPSAQVGGLIPVRLSLYALDGREVLHLHDGPLSPGTHQFRFFTSFRMTSGVNMPSGVYLLRLQAGSHSRTVKAVLMR